MIHSFENICIVLVETSHPGNIGSAARAMKTMGLKKLYLVNPEQFPHPKAFELAASAQDVLAAAQVFSSLTEALKEFQLIFATSARMRGLTVPVLSPKASADKIKQQSNAKIAIVFGRERSGLTNQELLQAHVHIAIPTSADYGSLNLAQAVQIICYEIHCAKQTEQKPNVKAGLATAEEIEQFYLHLTQVMTEVEFYHPKRSKNLLQRLRRLFNRCELEAMEVSILRGLLKTIQQALTARK